MNRLRLICHVRNAFKLYIFCSATIIRTTEVTHQPQTAVIVIVDLAILVMFASVRRQDSQGVAQLVLRVEI